MERLEAKERTNRTSGMRMAVSSTDLLYVPNQGVGMSSDTAWGFLSPAECRDCVHAHIEGHNMWLSSAGNSLLTLMESVL